MGTAVNGLAAMYPAIEKASEQTSNIPTDYSTYFASDKTAKEQYYLNVADNVAETVIGATSGSYGGPQYIDGTSPGDNVLSERCPDDPNWPDQCDLSSGPAWLIGKGIFTRSVYCLSTDLADVGQPDSGLGTFITHNGASVWQNDQSLDYSRGDQDVDQFGFMWDNNLFYPDNSNWPSSGTQTGQGVATQASALEALNANIGQSTVMCDGHLTN